MRTAWKHGVLGLDDADSKQTQCFYKDARDEKEAKQRSKDFINSRRTDCLALGMGTSDQIQIGSPNFKRTESLHHKGTKDEVVFIHKDWKAKHSVPLEINPPRMETT